MILGTVEAIGDICRIVSGGTPSRARTDFFGGGIPWVKIADMLQGEIASTEETISKVGLENSSAKLLPEGTVLISIFATIGRTAVLRIQAATNQAIAGVLPNDPSRLDSGFLRYFLDSKHGELNKTARGVAQPNINLSILKALRLPLPSLAEQCRIVDILNHAASIRRLRQQALDKTRALIPALFIDMFGDPASNPKGWPVALLGELVIEGPQNGLYKHASAYGEGTPILRIDAFYDGVVTKIQTLRRLQLSSDEIDRYRLKENDIVINRVNSPEYLGKSAIIPALTEPTVFESNMMRFSLDLKRILPRYLIQYLQTAYIKQQILSNAKHAINQSSINQQDVKSLPVPVPPMDQQVSFADRVADLQSLITQQERHLAQAEALLQSLMARYFNGSETGNTSRSVFTMPMDIGDFSIAAEETEKYLK